MKFIYISLVIIALIILKPIYWIVSPSGPINTKTIWLNYISFMRGERNDILLKDVANFNWDFVYIFSPYYHSEINNFSDMVGEFEMPQMLFFLNGKLVHAEAYSFKGDRFGLVNPDLNLSENQVIFVDKHNIQKHENGENINDINSKYLICNKDSKIVIYKTDSAKERWPGRIFWAYVDKCIQSNSN